MTSSQAGAGPTVVGIFAKRPSPGEVKTRLEPALGPVGAARLAEALLDDAVGRLGRGAPEAEVVFTPAEERAWFEGRYPGQPLRPQRGAGLAERLEAWFAEVLGAGARAALAVGSDSPWTTPARVAEAVAALDAGTDVVLGPDLGGGYYLVGARAAHPGLFTDTTMSTGTMFEETLTWLAARDLTVALLPTDYDLDLPEDLDRLRRDLAAPSERRADVAPEAWPRAVEAFVRGLDS